MAGGLIWAGWQWLSARRVDTWIPGWMSTIAAVSCPGLAVGHPVRGSIAAAVCRLVVGFGGRRRLSTLLKAGRTRVVGASALYFQDSELVSDALSSEWRSPSKGSPWSAHRDDLLQASAPSIVPASHRSDHCHRGGGNSGSAGHRGSNGMRDRVVDPGRESTDARSSPASISRPAFRSMQL